MITASEMLLSSKQVADRRAPGPHVSMFARMLLRAAVLRRRRAASALLAMIVAAAVATAMMNLYVDVQAKLRSEFRNYGANVVIVAKDGQTLPTDALTKVESVLGAKTLAVPFSYAVARSKDGQSVVVVGTDFARARQLNHWWKVNHWPEAPDDALVGMRAATVVSNKRQPFELSFQGKTIQLTPAGMLQTGAGEDSRIYLDQSEFRQWTGVAPSTIEIAANGTTAEVDASIRQLAQLLPAADVRPVRQIMEGEANVLTKTRATLYASATLVILTSALCVLATLMGWVFDRRRDFAIMKALGASERLVNGFFAAEAAALGVIGAIFGFFIGIGVAAWIGRVNFHAPVVPRFSVFPYVLAGSITVALISAILPIVLLRRVQPAIILRGE
ncbi:MAG TPA: ABC transporter permease [Terriglobales bacterium]|jgi:putative ABC transport system permease protein|nr:ABC transporter permease [Terriglobales bacterium]